MSEKTPTPAAMLASRIDHTLLKPDATEREVVALCEQAITHNFAAVCVNSIWVPLCARLLQGASSAVCTTVGFPLGAMLSSAKTYETEQAVAAGADEVDMVMWIGGLLDGKDAAVKEDIAQVVKAAAPGIVKVIIEAAVLTDDQKTRACELAVEAGAHFVKTSTGFSGGATRHDTTLMRATVGSRIGVKASGGIRTAADAWALIEAGANRIGTSAGMAIMREEK